MNHDQIVRQLVRWNKATASDPRDPDPTRSALCFSCDQPVDRDGVATGLNATGCFYCREDV